jgi:hypothetical protein
MVTFGQRMSVRSWQNQFVIGTTAVKTNLSATYPGSLLGLRLALILAVALAGRLLWLVQHADKLDMPPFIPFIVLGELPLVVAAVFVTRNKGIVAVVTGAGCAFGSALVYSILSPALYLLVLGAISDTGDSHRSLVALRGFIPIPFLASLWLLKSASRQRAQNRSVFDVSVGVAIGYAVLALFVTRSTAVAGSGVIEEKRNFELPLEIIPTAPVRALTACLIRHRFLHPEADFPASLKAASVDWNCDTEITNPGGYAKYWIFYSPVRDLTTRRNTDFRIEAIPTDQRLLYVQPVVSDGRGAILSFPPNQTVNSGDSPTLSIYVVRNRVLEFMQKDFAGRPPLSLDEFQNGQQGARFSCDDLEPLSERRIKIGRRSCYSITYFPPSHVHPYSFAISAQCRTYGDGCLRSYFLDYDGFFHATAEPRQAIAQDPTLLPCEVALVCNDPVWIYSEQPSKWAFFKAKTYDSIHSTNWW